MSSLICNSPYSLVFHNLIASDGSAFPPLTLQRRALGMSVDKIFEALASRSRREILAYLSKAELTTSELAARFQMTAPSMSRHLTVLENAGLVASERKGQRVLYRLNPSSLVSTLTGYAFEICPVAGPLKRESRALAKRRRATE
jgi:ArsR family transcriptional regulator, arsenate/arsenite/antimonite-responsive transcriptional repressor